MAGNSITKITKPNSRQREILEVVLKHGWDYMRLLLSSNQAEEPELPPPTVLQRIFVDLGPVYVKLGQLLSTRPELLPPEYIEALSSLQADVPPVSWTEIEAQLNGELKQPLDTIFQDVNQTPVAAGSLAQTHKAVLLNGREVALKIQRPGIDETVERDIELLTNIAELVSGTDFGKYYDVTGLAEEFSNALRDELDFTQEAHYTERLRRCLSKSSWFDVEQITVPEIIWDYTSQKLLTMEWLDGVPLLSAEITGERYNGDPQAERNAITTLLFRSFLQQLFIEGFFHADPHPGNIFYLHDGRVAFLDVGMTGTLDPRTQGLLVETILAMITLDAQRCAQLTLQLAHPVRAVDFIRLENDYDRLLRRYYNLSVAQVNFSEAFYQLLQAARRNHLRWPSNMGLYAKALANLEGVARTFNPQVNLLDEIQPLTTDLMRRQLIGENPLQQVLGATLEFKNLSLKSPRQVDFLLERVATETLKWNLQISELTELRQSLDESANRLSSSVVVGALILAGALVVSRDQTHRIPWLGNVLFWTACLLGLWLVFSIWRSGSKK
ncbi:MAG: AarF/ABC1/UbiB kinase family protein [Sodalinema sp.]|uniref:ABC1 kinase family protein n=1 Tax=Sodalinema sp. TaxID=3080550 RepID=UPI0011FEAE72|nr:MAG: AarF/ABC1/UbiB kinase family protein [Phormidium sp. SL48-SHIP]